MLVKSKLNIKPKDSFLCHHLQKKSQPFILRVICEYLFPLFFPFFLVKISDFLRT